MPYNSPNSIKNTAANLGVTTYVLRIWEDRYGWPRPKRHKNGYRAYDDATRIKLHEVVAKMKDGRSVSNVLQDFGLWNPDEKPVRAI